MDLLKLGAQARKTGLKPRPNIAKDKYDMEDVDEFFNDTTWPDSKQNTTLKELEVKIRGEPESSVSSTARKNLGVGRIRSGKNAVPRKDPEPPISKLVEQSRSTPDVDSNGLGIDVYPDLGDVSDYSEIDVAEEQVQQHEPEDPPVLDQDFEATQDFDQNGHSDGSGNSLDDLQKDMTLSPIPLLSLKSKTELQAAPRSPLSKPEQTPLREAGKLTKSMALGTRKPKKRPVIQESDNEDDGETFREERDPILSDGDDEFDSDFMESQFTQSSSYKTSQDTLIRPSPLPSPPPEGLRRSKRTKIAPLAYWRNERIVYSRALEQSNGDPDSTLVSDIRKVPLQEIREVVHIPEAQKVKPKPKRGRPPKNGATNPRGRKPKPKPGLYDYESDPEIEGSEWFKEKSLEAEVFESEDNRVKRVVAWSPEGGDFQTPPAGKNGQTGMENFKVAPLFDFESDVIAAGLLEFPVDGFKSLRTTGESLFVFHVAKGLIEVTLNSDKFVVTRGCSFEIPKLNIYSFKNIGQGTARLFFVQCQLT